MGAVSFQIGHLAKPCKTGRLSRQRGAVMPASKGAGTVLVARVTVVRTNRLFWEIVWRPPPWPAFRARGLWSLLSRLLISTCHILEEQVNTGDLYPGQSLPL